MRLQLLGQGGGRSQASKGQPGQAWMQLRMGQLLLDMILLALFFFLVFRIDAYFLASRLGIRSRTYLSVAYLQTLCRKTSHT